MHSASALSKVDDTKGIGPKFILFTSILALISLSCALREVILRGTS